MCALIFAAKIFKDEWQTEFNPFAKWVGEENDMEANCGDGKQYPFGSTCTFKGKQVPCYCCSESRSINGKHLTDML
jgi:hypothetical protein